MVGCGTAAHLTGELKMGARSEYWLPRAFRGKDR